MATPSPPPPPPCRSTAEKPALTGAFAAPGSQATTTAGKFLFVHPLQVCLAQGSNQPVTPAPAPATFPIAG